jgi:hypothetical protein
MMFFNLNLLILTPSDNVIFSQSSSDLYLFRKYCHMTLGLRGREYHRTMTTIVFIYFHVETCTVNGQCIICEYHYRSL